MLSKERFVKFLEKYHLNGVVESAWIEVKDDVLSTTVKTLEGDMRGHVVLNDFGMNDGEIGCYSTSSLLKMLSILDSDINIIPAKRESDGFINALNISDVKGKKIRFATHESDIIDRDGKKGNVKEYEVRISLNNENIDDILRAYSALNSNITFLQKNNKFYVVFNYSQNNENNIEIQIETEKLDEDFEFMTFDARYIKNILEVNKKRYADAYIELSVKGIAKFHFEDVDSTAEYWIVKLQD